MRIYDHTGKRYGTWTVIEMFFENEKKYYRLLCDCGNTKISDVSHLKRKNGCEACKPILKNNSYYGKRNGNLTCLGYIKTKQGRHGLLVKCDCGNQYEIQCYSQFMKTSSCKRCRHGSFPGKKAGNSILLERTANKKWKKRCGCGNIFTGDSRKKDCGCIFEKHLIKEAMKKIGLKYHLITITKIVGKQNGHILFLIKCKCGNEFIRSNGHEFKSRSCGCELVVPIGEKASNASLKNCEVLSMREFYESGVYSLKELSEMFNKSENYILRIVKRRIWKHI